MTATTVTVGYLHPGTVATVFHKSLTDLLFYDATHHQRIVGHQHGEMAKRCGAAGIVDGRNEIARFALESGVDWLFMIDADMAFPPDIVDKLLHVADPTHRPVMGGLAFAHKNDGKLSFYGQRFRPQPTLYTFLETDDRVGFVPMFDYPRDSVVPVSATGAAVVLVHRSVFEAVEAKFGPVWFDTIRHPKGAHFSEDLAFCVRVAACDIPLHVNTAAKTGHDKGGVFYDEQFYDEWRAHREVTDDANPAA